MNYHSHLDHRSLRFHELIAAEFVKDPVAVRQKAISTLKRWKKQGSWCTGFSKWEKLLKRSSDQYILSIMLEKSDRGDALRQTSPFVGIISEEQRMAVIEEFRRMWEDMKLPR